MGSCVDKDRTVENRGASAQMGNGGDKGKGKGKRVKILLLGAGESGKSTIAKQLKILHLKGFKEEEILQYKKQVHSNILTNVKLLIKGAETLDIPLQNEALAKKIAQPDYMGDGVLTPDIANEIKTLWKNDSGIREAFSRGTEFHLVESTSYYFDNIDRISQPGYRPNNDDILKSRRLTVGAEEIDFYVDGYQFHVIDVGGQKGEREKWIDYFQNNQAVIFFVALSEYDQKLAEDNSTNRMTESLKLFSDVCNHQWFADAAIILFLNKSDIFQEKIRKIPLTVAFLEYRGRNEFDEASQYIQSKFIDRINNKKKKVYPYITNATNSENFNKIFTSVKDIVITAQFESLGYGI